MKVPTAAKRRPTHAGTATQTRILLAVCALANEAGLGAVSIATVAERAGCAKASVLYHFATREALLVAAVDAALAPWWQAQRAALRGSGDARAALDAWIEAVFGCGEAALRLRAQVDAEPPNQPATVLLSDAERDIEAESSVISSPDTGGTSADMGSSDPRWRAERAMVPI